ncbi:phage late control D family protein [Hydrogenimonas sp.]
MSELAKKYNRFLAPEAVVWVNGMKLSQKGIFVSDLKVDMVLDGADTFSFTVGEAIDLASFDPKKESRFRFGDLVEIHMGYADSDRSKKDLPILFKGVVTSIKWSFSEESYLEMTVEGMDFSFLMMKHKFRRREGAEPSWNGKSDADAVREIVTATYRELFDKVAIEEGGTLPTRDQIRHKEESDFAFFTALAKRNGYEFFVQAGRFHFRPPPAPKGAAVKLGYGEEILSFVPEFSVDRQVAKVRVTGLELGPKKERIVAEAPEGKSPAKRAGTSALRELLKNLNNIEYEVRAPVASVEEARKLAESKYRELSSGLLKAQLKSIGLPDLRPGVYIGIEGIGPRFSRLYYVAKAVHSFGSDGYVTELQLQSDSFTLSKGGGE